MVAYTPDMTIAEMFRARLAGPDAPTEEEAAQAIGVKQPSVNRWKNGRSAPGPANVPAVARFLGASEAAVLAGIQNMKVATALPSAAGNVRYLMDQFIAYEELLPPERRKAAREIIEEMFQWVPEALDGALQSQFATAADEGKASKPAKRARKRPSPEPNE